MTSTITEFVDSLRESSIGRKILRERHERQHAERSAIVAEHQQLVARAAELQVEPPAEAKLRERAESARAAAERATTAHQDARGERTQAAHAAQAAANQIGRTLRQTADPRIAAARHAMTQRFQDAREHLARTVEVPTGERDSMTLAPVVEHRTNEAQIRALHAAMAAARIRFTVLELETPDDVEAAIAAILEPVEAAWQAAATFGDE